MIGVEVGDAGHLSKPVERGGVDIAHGDKLRAHGTVEQREPAAKRARDFAAGFGCWIMVRP